MRTLATIFAALLGLAFGSFLNVCLSRWPEGESVALPRSHCRQCARTLAWYENIPLFSWIALRGRCRTCKAWIGWRYPLVEVLVGGLWGYQAWQIIDWLPALTTLPVNFALHAEPFLAQMILEWLLVALAFLDVEHYWLPNWLTLGGVVLGVAHTVLLHVLILCQPHMKFVSGSFFDMEAKALIGALVAAGIILFVRWLYWLLRKREGLGLGDAKLMAMLGAWLGLAGALQALVLGSLLCTLLALVLLVLPRRQGQEPWALQKLPLGTFLCMGGLISSLWGEGILNAYLRWAGY